MNNSFDLSSSTLHSSAGRSPMSAAARPSTSTKDKHVTRRCYRKDADTVSPGVVKTALARFRSLEAVSTTSTTTSGSSHRTSSFDVTPRTLMTSQLVPGDSRRVVRRERDDASKHTTGSLPKRPTDNTKRQDKMDDGFRKLNTHPRFEEALMKFRSMEDEIGTCCSGSKSSIPHNITGNDKPLTTVVRRNAAPSSPSSLCQQISPHEPSAIYDIRPATPSNTVHSVPDVVTRLYPEELAPSRSFQSVGSVAFQLREPSSHRRAQNVSVPPSASRRTQSNSDVGTVTDDDKDSLDVCENLGQTSASNTSTLTTFPPQTNQTATVRDLPKTMKSFAYVRLETTSADGVSPRCIQVSTNHHEQLTVAGSARVVS